MDIWFANLQPCILGSFQALGPIRIRCGQVVRNSTWEPKTYNFDKKSVSLNMKFSKPLMSIATEGEIERFYLFCFCFMGFENNVR